MGFGQAPGIRWTSTIVALLTLASAPELAAQVGLSSGVAQVALVARIAPRVDMPVLSLARELDSDGTMKEVAVSVRGLANTGYRLVVVGTEAASGSTLWVRGVGGEFQELTPGAAVTVARDVCAAGDWEREVSYRTAAADSDGRPEVLPVRYEIRVDPTL